MPEDRDSRRLTEAAEHLERRAEELSVLVERLALAAEVPRPEIDQCIEALLHAGRRLREYLNAGARQLDEPSPGWSDRAGLQAAVRRVAYQLDQLARGRERQRIEALARELRNARLSHRVEALRRRLEQFRATVVEALPDAFDSMGTLPWPAHDEPSWVLWILSLADPAATRAYENVSRVFPALAELLGSLDPSHWIYPIEGTEPSTGGGAMDQAMASRNELQRFPFCLVEQSDVRRKSPAEPTESANFGGIASDVKLDLNAAEAEPGSTFLPEPTSSRSADTSPAEDSDFVVTVFPDLASDHEEVVQLSPDEAAAQQDPEREPFIPRLEVQETSQMVHSGPSTSDAASSSAVTAETEPRAPADHLEAGTGESTSAFAESFPDALISLQNFRRSFWRDGRGRLVPAPWNASEFPLRLANAAAEALRQLSFNRLVVFCRTAHIQKITSLPVRDDLHSMLALLDKPDGPVPDGGDARLQALLAGESHAGATLRHQFMIFLVALCASPENAVPETSIAPIVEDAGFADTTVGAFLMSALRLGLEADNPLGRLRAELRKAPLRSSAELEHELAAADSELREQVKHLYSAAGGRVQRTHCRRAWEEFMLAAKPVFDGVLAGAIKDIRTVDGLIELHARIADRGGAKYQDRNAMDRSARQLADLARRIVITRREHARYKQEQPAVALANLVTAYRALNDRGAQADVIFVPLLRTLSTAPAGIPAVNGPVFEKADFLRLPALLETVPVVATDEGPIAVDAWSLADPLSAAAHLLGEQSSQEPVPDVDLLMHLREHRREDLLVHVTPVSKADTTRAQEALKRAHVALHQALAAAQRQVDRIRQVAHPAAQSVAQAVQEALTLVEHAGSGDLKPELLTEWMTRVAEFADTEVATSIRMMREQFERLSPAPTGERQEHFQRALQRDRLAEARALANGENLPPSEEGERATMWRRVAVRTFIDSRRILRQHRGEPAALIQSWLAGLHDEGRDDELRRLFARFVFASELVPVEHEKQRTSTIKNKPLRDWIAHERLNPSFVPQLTAFKEITIITAPVPPTADSFVRQTAEAVGRAPEGRITVILAPAITPQVRDTLREDLRRRSARGYAILDDIDFARLVNPGGQQPNAVLGLLEIVLEQQPTWSSVNPYELSEGQHSKAEMFVGREDEAKELAVKAQFSRLFSGRKLGKSALLKHIRDTQKNVRLPSGNKLRVLYVPVVGLDSEGQVVQKIAECFAAELEHSPSALSSDPPERLKELVSSYLERKKRESVLVFLDEADMFVEAQIRDYEVRREKCLTWLMRTDLEAQRDVMDLPRIRFVFAGYRATHRNEAAWANWGDVLRLEPLSIDAATRLAKGPLARLGIDASEEAATIAYLCGYQPAVIVQFGRRLVELLDASHGPARREAVLVRPEDVAVAYQSSDVQNELRTIVWNNFVGNPFGRVVFAVMLLEFARLAPAVPLDDAPQRILRRLRELVPGALVENSLEGSPGDRIARELREFVTRSLLQLVDAATQSYTLRFPHHLTILLQDVQEASIRREAGELGESPGAEQLQEVRTLLPRVGLLDLGEALATDGFDGAVAVSHWTDCLTEGAGNVPTRLGLRPDDLFDALDSVDGGASHLRRPSIGVLNATPEAAERVLGARDGLAGHRPLFVGGLDLLRWALSSRRNHRHELELACVSRLNPAQLRWWFERVRAIEFAGLSPVREFLELTAGIPFLVGLLDRALEREVGFDGTNATEDQVHRVLVSCRSQFQKYALGLVFGNPSVKLDRREAELFVMVQCASQWASNSVELQEMLASAEDWPEVFPWAADKHRLSLRSGDEAHIELLLRTGLLPSAQGVTTPGSLEALTPIPPGDAAHRLAEVITPCLSP